MTDREKLEKAVFELYAASHQSRVAGWPHGADAEQALGSLLRAVLISENLMDAEIIRHAVAVAEKWKAL